MIMLIAGLLLFTGIHLIPAVLPGLRDSLRQRIGEGGYKGLFTLGVGAGLALIIFGWRSSVPDYLYTPPPALRHPAMALVCIALLLVAASNLRTRLRRLVRHPQLTGVLLWALAHLALNGDSRSLLLFGSLALWTVVEILAINRREGVWIKDEAPGIGAELRLVAFTAVLIAVLVYLHPWLSGMPILPAAG